MKRWILSLAVFLWGISSPAYGQMPWDLAYHALPVVPTFDIPEEVSQISGNLQSSINQSKQIILQAKSDITNLQSAVTATFEDIKSGAIVEIDGAPGQGEATFCGKNLNDVKVKKIAKKMKQIFLTYKSKKSADIASQEKMRDKFYIESMYTIYIAARELQKELNQDIKAKVDMAKSCADGQGAECGFPSTDEGGNNEVLFAYGKTLEAFDSVIRVWENVAALKARMKALEIMRKMEPAVATKADQADGADETQVSGETAFLQIESRGPAAAVARLHNAQPLAFAQVAYKGISSSLANIEAEVSGSNSEAMSLISQTVEFASPDEADNEHPLVEAEAQLEALSSLSSVEETVNEAMSTHNMLGELDEYKQLADQIVEMRADYQKSLRKLQDSEKCTINYLNRYFSNPAKVWSGVSLGANVNRHDLRKGISGWAIEAFEMAKAAETSTVTSDDLASVSLDEKSKSNLSDDPDMAKAEEESQKINVSLNAGKQEEAQEENRRSSLLAWQIGAEASKMIGEDAGKWGSPRGTSLVWNDTKNFYQQYLRRKYENVKSYLKSYTSDDVLALVISKLKGQDSDISETKYQKQLKDARLKASQNIVSTVASQAQYDSASQAELDRLQKKRDALVAKMDKVNGVITENRNSIADMRAVAEDSAAQKIDETVNAKVVFPSAGQTVQSASVKDKIIGADNLASAISGAATDKVDEKKIASLEKEADASQKQLDNYEKELEELDAKIAQTRQNAQSTAGQARRQGALAVEKIQNQLTADLTKNSKQYAADVRKNLEEVLKSTVKESPVLTIATLVAGAQNAAKSSLNALYAQVDAIVEAHYQQMLSMGDRLYQPSSHERLVKIHEQMIEELRALTLAYNAMGLIQVNNIAVYAKLLDIDTSAETEGFFVGAAAKARDLKAPFAIPDFNSLPPREVFHFDATDFANIKPYVEGQENNLAVTAAEFLNSGRDIPLIWQYMLKENAFVESQFDLQEALTSNCGSYAFLRGGIMPCVIDGSSVIVDVNAGGSFIRRNDGAVKASSLPKCYLMEMKNGRPHHKFQDVDISFSMTTRPQAERERILNDSIKENDHLAYVPPAIGCKASELGMFLRAEQNNSLFFNDWVARSYNAMLRNTDGKELSDKQKNEIAGAYYASFSRNQIGDFLRLVENEKLQRENLEEYQQKYDAQMDELKEKLRNYGFAPSAGFDLSKDSDYRLAVEKLKALKSQKLSQAESALAAVDRTDNEPVQEKAGNLDKLVSIMRKDTDGLLKVSVTTADNNNLDAELKKAKADAALVDKYKNSLKDQGQEYNDIEDPYCANY